MDVLEMLKTCAIVAIVLACLSLLPAAIQGVLASDFRPSIEIDFN
jgi:hypothetical protein